MDAPNLHNITPKAWGEVLGKYVDSKNQTTSQGRVYIYLNSENQIKLLSKSEAEGATGFSKLSLKKIIDLTIPMLRNAGAEVLFEHLEVLGNKLAAKQIKQAPQTKTATVKQTIFNASRQKVSPANVSPTLKNEVSGHNLVTPERLSQLSLILKVNPSVSRSGDGRDGVFYLEHPSQPKMVLKFCSDVHRHILADKLIEKFFQTPQYQSLSSDMEEAKNAVDLVSEKGRENLKAQLSELQQLHEQGHPNLQGKIGLLSDRIRDLDWILKQGLLTASFVNATTFKDQMASDRVDLFSNKKFLQELGEMVLVDTFLHNTDRVSEYQCNKANFMINEDPSAAKLIICIDHDFNCSAENLSMVVTNLTNLLKGDGIERRLKLLLEGENLEHGKIAEIIPEIQEGVVDAAKTLVQLMHSSKAQQELFDLPSKDGCITADPAVINKLVEHLQTLLT